MWEYLDLLRIYTKLKGAAPDFNEPVILPKKKCSIDDFYGLRTVNVTIEKQRKIGLC